MSVEPPEGWGPTRLLMTELGRLGCEVTEYRKDGGSVLEIVPGRGRPTGTLVAELERLGYTVAERRVASADGSIILEIK